MVVFAMSASFALLAGAALAPAALLASTATAVGELAPGPSRGPGQSLSVQGDSTPLAIDRDDFTYTTGRQSLIAGGTNYDWAKLVLLDAGWPVTDSNVAVMTRWMRRENGPDDWWNRNNPLNNGYGSGGGSGLGSYDTLATAAAMAAENLQNYSGYVDIRAGFAASAPTGQIEAAIWASPWATSHYGNGSHWSQTPVPVVTAPAEAWR